MTEAAMKAAREIMAQIEPGNRVTVKIFATIIAKHLPTDTEAVKLLSEQDYEYNRKTNAMIERQAARVKELWDTIIKQTQKIDEQAAIIAKHFPSPVAAEGDVVGLRAALRAVAIDRTGMGPSCRLCGKSWMGHTDAERHAPNCLAALSAQPASVGGVGEGQWSVETTDNEGAYGGGPNASHGFKSYRVIDENGKTIVDTLNSDVGEVHEEFDEDGRHAWDAVGQKNCERIVALHNAALPSPTAIEPQAEWRDGVEALKNVVAAFHNYDTAPVGNFKMNLDILRATVNRAQAILTQEPKQ